MNRYRSSSTAVAVLALAAAGLLTGLGNYLLFHAVAETFSAVVALAAFLLAFNARHLVQGRGLLVRLGVVLLAVGCVDLLHMLAYSGMGVFGQPPGEPRADADLATQLWLVGRMLFALGLPAALLLRGGERSLRAMLVVVSGLTVTLVGLVFAGAFPTSFHPVAGLTPFKITVEIGVCLLLVASGWLLWHLRRRLEARLVRLVGLALALSIASELSFMTYSDPFGLTNMAGHLLKIAAYVLLYKALVELGLREPFAVLFAELKHSESALAAANRSLEARVAERTAELERRQDQLRRLAHELTQVERRERRRLAGQLHDELAQLLAAMRMRLGALRADDPERVEHARAALAELVDEAVRFTRELISQLTPPRLEQGGLVEALRAFAERMARQHAFAVEVSAETRLPVLDAEVRETVFNGVRELLVNAAKHSGSAGARVHLAGDGAGRLLVVVEDDGVGFDPGRLPERPGERGGFGLFYLREQIELTGGTLDLASAPQRGTRAELRVPSEGAATAAASG